MKTKLLFTAALMSAAALYSEQAIGENTMRYLNAVNTSEVVMTADVNEQQESGVDISKWVLWNSKMETLASWDQCGWLTDVQGGNFSTYTMPTDANINKGECPYPNAVERWQGAELKYAANTNILYQKINVPNGDYTVTMWAESQDLEDHTHKGGMFVFANEVQQDITNHCTLQQYTLQVTVTDGTLTLGVKTGENGSDDNHVVMAAVTILADQNIIDGISTDNPLDVTGAVKNSSCVAGFGWSKNTLNASASYNVNNSALDSEDYKGIGIEYWTGSNNPTKNADLIYQEIYNLPAGKYKVSAVAMGRNQGGGDVCEEGLYLFANDGESTVTTNVWGKVTVEGIVLADGILRVGLRAGENNGNNWLAISRVEVEFVGEDLTAMKTALEQKVTEAHALAVELKDLIPTSYITQLSEFNPVCSTSEEYLEALSVVNKLINDANESKSIFNYFYLSVQKYAEYLLQSLDADDEAKNALNTKIDLNNDLAFNSTEQSVWKEAGSSILEACRVFYDSSKGLVKGVSNLDVTPLWVVNAGFDEKTMDGWNCTVSPDLNYGMPSFIFNKWNHPTFDFYQEVNVPNGLYNVSVQEHAAKGDKTDLYIQSSEARMTAKMNWNHGGTVEQAAKDWENNKDLNRVSTGNVLVVDGKVRIGVNVHTPSDGALFYDNFRLTVAPSALSLNEENESLGIDSDTYANITVERILKADGKWNTFCVPFAMTAEQLDANKITDVRKLVSTEEKDGSVVLNFSDPVTEIEAGVPYIVKVSETVSQITVNGVAVKVAEPAPLEVCSVNMQGNYGKMSITGDQYFISDNKFYRAADKNVTVKGFRAYITMDQAAAGVNQMLINIDGNVTAIEDVLGEDVDATVNVYTIDGVCVKSGVKSSEALDGLRKGIYIVNGKKVVK